MATAKPIDLATEIVSAFVANNSVPKTELIALFEAVHAAVKTIAEGATTPATPVALDPPEPAVPIRKSVFPTYIVCLEDGKKFKSLRRHLGVLGMTPEQYRTKWGLPSTYPMVAPNYSARRSELAKSVGLGHVRTKLAVSKGKGEPKSATDETVRKLGNPRKIRSTL